MLLGESDEKLELGIQLAKVNGCVSSLLERYFVGEDLS
jgi:hypothetical protein